jgi:formylglycine-generating enzyme required for sulfatase activity
MDTKIESNPEVQSGNTPRQVPPYPGMVWIPGGTFQMGSDKFYAEEQPIHKVTVDGFWMDQHTVTNEEWSRFINETGHVTFAERPAKAEDYPGAAAELLAPASVVFRMPKSPVDLANCYNWWTYVRGADWRHPDGPESSAQDRAKHPVVHVAYEDVEAYARWIGKELPTEAEWEFAARGGLDSADFVWGNDFTPRGVHMANTWQGEFPWQNLKADGFEGTAPVGSFPPNGYGLYDMAGNVWEWTTDWFQEHSKIQRVCCGSLNPKGGVEEASYDPRQPSIKIPRRVMKGGSYLCSPNYCRRYRPAARMPQPIDTSTCHLGFRCIVRSKDAAT